VLHSLTNNLSPIYLIDILFIALIGYASIYYYKKKIYNQLFDYFKVFIIISISAKFASFSGKLLQKLYIISTDTYSILILIGFSINFLVIFYGYHFIFKLLDNIINSNKIRTFLAKTVTFFEVVAISSFILFMSMQTYPTKKFIEPTLKKSIIYPKIKGFYIKFLNDNFIKMILNNDSTMDTKEIIFKSLKNSIS